VTFFRSAQDLKVEAARMTEGSAVRRPRGHHVHRRTAFESLGGDPSPEFFTRNYAMKPTVKAFVRYTRFFRVVYPRKFRGLRQFRARAIRRVRRLEGFFGVPKPDALARMCDRLQRVSGAWS
jgi:hypothetical protein